MIYLFISNLIGVICIAIITVDYLLYVCVMTCRCKTLRGTIKVNKQTYIWSCSNICYDVFMHSFRNVYIHTDISETFTSTPKPKH